MGALTPADPEVINALADLGAVIATTNYDNLISQVTHLPAVPLTDTDKIIRIVEGQDKGIIHLHGCWERPETVVLGIRSYEGLLRDEAAQSIQKALHITKTLLFVGLWNRLTGPQLQGIA